MNIKRLFRNLQQDIHSLHEEEGQSLVEMVLTVPFLAILVVVMVNSAFIFQTYITVTNAANSGAIYGASGLSAALNKTAIRDQVLAESDTWHCPSPVIDSTTSGDGYGFTRVSVTVTCEVSDLVGFANILDDITVSYTAVRRVKP